MSDSPTFTSKDYNKHENQIIKVRALYDGSDSAVKFLRQFPKEENDVYAERQEDSALDSFVYSTANTIKNIIFRKPIDLTGVQNSQVQEWLKKVDFVNSINKFSKNMMVNRILDGKTYLLVDRMTFNPEETQNGSQQSDFDKQPYFVNILRNNVFNKEYDIFNTLTKVSIREFYTEKIGEFGSEEKEQVKVWYNDGKIEVWRDDKVYSSLQTKLKVIPLIEIGNDENPPLYNQAKLNVQHFNRNSECSNYVRTGASPFLAVFGNIDGGDKPKTLGINSGLKFSDVQQSDVKWVEMTGKNYEIINKEITKLEDQMLRIAINFVSDQQNKTATQVEKESMEAESKLTDYAKEIEEGISDGLALMQLYSDAPLGENTIEMNKDYSNNILTPEQANSYRLDYTQGIISLDRLWQLYAKGEYIPLLDEKKQEAEKALLKDSGI